MLSEDGDAVNGLAVSATKTEPVELDEEQVAEVAVVEGQKDVDVEGGAVDGQKALGERKAVSAEDDQDNLKEGGAVAVEEDEDMMAVQTEQEDQEEGDKQGKSVIVEEVEEAEGVEERSGAPVVPADLKDMIIRVPRHACARCGAEFTQQQSRAIHYAKGSCANKIQILALEALAGWPLMRTVALPPGVDPHLTTVERGLALCTPLHQAPHESATLEPGETAFLVRLVQLELQFDPTRLPPKLANWWLKVVASKPTPLEAMLAVKVNMTTLLSNLNKAPNVNAVSA